MIVLLFGFGECWISYLYYIDYDTSSAHSFSLLGMTVILNVARETVARVLVLQLAIGYQIILNTIDEHRCKMICVISAYGIMLFLSLIVNYIMHTSASVKFLMFLMMAPASVLNFVIMTWVIICFKKTLEYLKPR
jgi:hypothetical protein